jgi:hypothetical protein
VTDDRVELGAGILALMDPHHGYEKAWNRWYERDHMYGAAIMAPWTIAGARFVATRDLKALRYPAQGPFGDAERGSYLICYWIQADHLADQQAWVLAEMKKIAEQGRNFDQRDAVSATAYDFYRAVTRDEDGVPPHLALDHRYPGVVLVVAERDDAVSLDDLGSALLDDVVGGRLSGSPIAMAVAFTPRPKEPWWPAAAPEVEGVGDRVFAVCFLETDPRDCWDEAFKGLGEALAASGAGRARLVAPFVATVPGTDTYVDQLW